MSPTRAPWSVANRIGFVIAGVFSLANIPSALAPTPDGAIGPPLPVLLADTVLAVIAVVCVVVAWITRQRVPARIAGTAVVLIALTGFPAFFVDVPAFVKVLVAASALVAVAACALILTPARQQAAMRAQARP